MMSMYASESAYRSAAAGGATQIGLITLVYDELARDLNHVAEAVSRDNIEARCKASNHALLLLGHLESWIQYLDDTTLAAGLTAFYLMLRSQILQLQQQGKPRDFEALATVVLATRAAWQRKEQMLVEALSSDVAEPPGSRHDATPRELIRASAWCA